MNINKLNDDTQYLKIRNGVKIFYFGTGGFADYDGDTIAHFRTYEMLILSLINGIKTINEVKEMAYAEWKFMEPGITVSKIHEQIQSLVYRGIIVVRKVPANETSVIYGQKGKYYPKDLTIELTNECNFKCNFCYKNAKFSGKYITDSIISELDSVIHDKVHSILFTGGEPTLHPKFAEYLKLFSEYAEVRMVTNGSKLFEIQSPALEKLKLIQFSMYGCNDIEYEKATGIPDGFSRLTKSVEFAIRKKIPFVISSTIKIEDMDFIEDYIKAAIRLKSAVIRIAIAEPYGRARNGYNNNLVREKTDVFLNELLRLKRVYRKHIKVGIYNINTEHFTNQNYTRNNEEHLNCGGGTETVVISQDGMLRVCEFLPEQYFNLGGIDVLKAQIEGNFQKKQFCECVKKYLQAGDMQSKMDSCQSLKMYYEKHMQECL